MQSHTIPISIITGLHGCGRTSLLSRICLSSRCGVVAVHDAQLSSENSSFLDHADKRIEPGSQYSDLEGLPSTIAALAASGEYDCLLVLPNEKTRTVQIAEVLLDEVDVGSPGIDEDAQQSVPVGAELDTCVTILDASTLVHLLLPSTTTLWIEHEVGGSSQMGSSLDLPHLLLGNIEFADVILLNKVDMVSKHQEQQLLSLLRMLSPHAAVFSTQHCQMDLSCVVGTGRFSRNRASKIPGWLQLLMDTDGDSCKQAVQKDVGGFVYRRRRPFHPQRLWSFLSKYALLRQDDADEDHDHDDEHCCTDEHCAHPHDQCQTQQQQPVRAARHRQDVTEPRMQAAGREHQGGAGVVEVTAALSQAAQAVQQAAVTLQALADGQQDAGESLTAASPPRSQASGHNHAAAIQASAAAMTAAAAAAAAAATLLASCSVQCWGHASSPPGEVPVSNPGGQSGSSEADKDRSSQQIQPSHVTALGFGKVARSKGVVWLASRPSVCGEWAQAGGVLHLGVGAPWYCELPEREWGQDEESRQQVLKDFREPHGDRRQELSFIGVRLDAQAICSALDDCLATDEEMALAASGQLSDPFASWPSLAELVGDDEGGSIGGGGEEEYHRQHGRAGVGEEGEGSNVDDNDEVFPAASPGCLCEVVEGAAEAQAQLDATPAQLAVLSWHAPWCAACVDTLPVLSTLAARHPETLLVMMLDVEGSAANQAAAMEKVLERPASRRAGAKPVLRGEEKFPCLTAHFPPSLQPAAKFTGAAAMRQLQAFLDENLELKATNPADTHLATNRGSTRNLASKGQETSSAEAATGVEGAVCCSSLPPGGQARPVEHVAADKNQIDAGRLVVLKKGAAEAKQVLSEGREAGTAVVVAWCRTTSQACQELRAATEWAAKQGTGAVFVDACPDVSKANALLAEALKVTTFPSLHVYRDMRLSQKVAGPERATPAALGKLLAELSLLGGHLAMPQARSHLEDPTSGAAVKSAALETSCDVPAPAAQGATAAVQRHPAGGLHHVRSIYDPPEGKFARPGATKRLDNGQRVHFFPKMPCLRCGCPWWTSDDWDARCVRCGWDCEHGGYDDNSQPLPKYRSKWEHFIALIKEGRTPQHVNLNK